MGSKGYKLSLICFSIFFAMTCCSQKAKSFDYDLLVKKGNELINKLDSKDIKVFAQISKKEYEKIIDINSYDREYLSIVNLFNSDDVNVYKVISESESGDSTCNVNYYYDQENCLKVSIVYSSYFNSICRDDVITQKTTYHYQDEKVIFEKVEYIDADNIIISENENCTNDQDCDLNLVFKYSDLSFLN